MRRAGRLSRWIAGEHRCESDSCRPLLKLGNSKDDDKTRGSTATSLATPPSKMFGGNFWCKLSVKDLGCLLRAFLEEERRGNR
jgi:hypothetical protein